MTATPAPCPLPVLPAGVAFSEDLLARVFSAAHASQLKYCAPMNSWLAWDGTRWRTDEKQVAYFTVRDFLRQVALDAPEFVGPRRLASRARVDAIERLARSDPAHTVELDLLDSRHWELNTPSGTVDLRTGKTGPHDSTALHTKLTRYSPGGECPRWHRFLREVFDGDDEVIRYVQRVLGYSCSGLIKEHTFFLAEGRGANGKSLLFNTWRKILGDYAYAAPAETFVAGKAERHPTELFALRGARFVLAQETEAGAMLAEARIKSLCGGDAITARPMRQDFVTFEPNLKLVISTNHLPRLRDTGEAMRRRGQVIKFGVTIPREQRDLALEGKLLAEGSGILQWAIEGALEWQKLGGLHPPAAVVEATGAYFDAQDPVAHFLASQCELAPDGSIPSRAAYERYAAWARQQAEIPLDPKRFKDALLSHGFTAQRSSACNLFRGLRLRATA